MAKDKKSFVLYSDYLELFEELSDSDAGKLAKHIFRYVNDLNPTSESEIIKISFIPIKLQLKRDLKHWESVRIKRSQAGKASAESRKQNQQVSTSVESVEQRSTKSTVTVNDNVTVNVTDNINKKDIPKFNFKTELLKLGIEKQIVEDWMKVRSNKKATNTQTAFKKIISQIEKSKLSPNDCIKTAVEKDWKGFEASWLNNINTLKSQQQIPTFVMKTNKEIQ